MSAPTEEEIRAAIARQWGGEIGRDFQDAFTGCQMLGDGLFDLDDMRPSEQECLDELTYHAIEPIRNQAQRQVNEAIVAAILDFAAEHPDAPRAKVARAPQGVVPRENSGGRP
jgi:hypothetical protein